MQTRKLRASSYSHTTQLAETHTHTCNLVADTHLCNLDQYSLTQPTLEEHTHMQPLTHLSMPSLWAFTVQCNFLLFLKKKKKGNPSPFFLYFREHTVLPIQSSINHPYILLTLYSQRQKFPPISEWGARYRQQISWCDMELRENVT